MVYQPPAGARDLLPLDVTQKSWIEQRLEQMFHRWGYHRIITSTLERMDTLMAGGAIQRSTVINLHNSENEELGLRPELTASIARTAVTHMGDASYPQRLYYNANVFRRTRELQHNRQQEFYQVGVELLGGGGLVADAEILLLLTNCLRSLSLKNWHLILGEAQITASLLSSFPEDIRPQVRSAIASLDRIAIDLLPLSEELQERARNIMDLRGNPTEVLTKLKAWNLDSQQQSAVDNLQSLVDLLCNQHKSLPIPLILDLSLIQTIDYYTGIVFEIVSKTDNQTRVLGTGGRYDKLLGMYHPQKQDIPGIGFAVFIEDLYQVLLSTQQLPETIPAINWLVVPQNQEAYNTAFAYAEKLRDSTHLVRVEIELGGKDPDNIRQYARDRGITKIAWVTPDNSPTIESVN
ncbi:MAG: ATP phosphoribosyltransferase regulatory subunit [Mastigocoleus sp.]